jgi:hypothetical protein
MRDGVHGAGRLAGVAANADFRVDQMLLQDAVFNQRDGAHLFSKPWQPNSVTSSKGRREDVVLGEAA